MLIWNNVSITLRLKILYCMKKIFFKHHFINSSLLVITMMLFISSQAEAQNKHQRKASS